MEEITLILIFAMRYVAMEGNLAMIALYATMAIPRTGMAAAANAKLNRQWGAKEALPALLTYALSHAGTERMLGSSNAMTETYLMEMDARQAAKLNLDFNA